MGTTLDFETELRKTGPIGVHRTFYQWNLSGKERRTIAADHANRRLPWVSFKPPGGAATWKAVGDGRHDAMIRERARSYASYSQPIIATFHHEPADDGRRGDLARQFRRAWCRVHDVMEDETNLQNVVSVPIIKAYVFNPWNRKDDPDDWATPDILGRCHFFGVDMYQTKSAEGYAVEVDRIRDHLRGKGFPNLMIGIGETGVSHDYRNTDAVQYWRDQWAWAKRNTDKVGVISYFNSNHNPNRPDWRLSESKAKLNAFRASLRSSKCVRL